jgi:hypothetical protein
MRRLLIIALASTGFARQSAADPDLAASSLWSYRSTGDLVIDGGLVVGHPTALPTGLATGIGAGVTRGRSLVFGARASWSTATESTMAWTVTHRDLRMRVTGGLQHVAGRGTFGLRLGLGGTLVHEARLRNQGERAGLTGDDLKTSALSLLPAADVEAQVALHVWRAWMMTVSGGPTVALDRIAGRALAGWSAGLGVAWRR